MMSEYSMDEEVKQAISQEPVQLHLNKINEKNKKKMDKFKQYAFELKAKHKQQQDENKRHYEELINKHQI